MISRELSFISGIDINLIVGTLQGQANFICPVCTDLFDDPIILACQHSYCRNCIKEVEQIGDGTCPMCQKYFDLEVDANSPSLFMKNMLSEIKLKV